MNIVLLGPPGVGKGTEANLLSQKLSLLHISTGDMLRQEVRENTDLGKKARSFMDHGKLVPDEIIMAMVKRKIGTVPRGDCPRFTELLVESGLSPGKIGTVPNFSCNGFVLDGIPRTLNQARVLDQILKEINSGLNFVIELEAGEEVLIERLSGRRVCKKCHALYHIVNMKPEKEGICDRCAGELYQREDDKVETIKRRLAIYRDQTHGLKEFYKKKDILLTVNTEGNAEETFKKIEHVIAKKNGDCPKIYGASRRIGTVPNFLG